MDTQKRATVYFEADVHRALRVKAAASDRSISDMVNDAVKAALAEDADDLAAFTERKNEKSLSFDTFVPRPETAWPNISCRSGDRLRRRSMQQGPRLIVCVSFSGFKPLPGPSASGLRKARGARRPLPDKTGEVPDPLSD